MNKKLLVTTSGFQRSLTDAQYEDDFVVVLTNRLSGDFNVRVLAPMDAGTSRVESLGSVKITRHRQFFSKNTGLAYGSGIVENIRKNKWLILLIPFYIFFQLAALVKILKDDKIDLIHAHWIIPQGLTAVLARKVTGMPVKILTTVHGSDFWRFNTWFGRCIIGFVLKNSDAVTAVSQTLKSEMEKIFPLKGTRICPMGVDTDRFRPGSPDDCLIRRLNIQSQCLLFVGYVTQSKGVDCLIRSIARLKTEDPTIQLLIIGEGNMLGEMKRLTRQLGLEKNVRFLGRIRNRDLPRYFSLADIFILPSISEGFPLVVMEALSSGTLTLVSDLPVFKPLEAAGILCCFKRGSDADLADRVGKVLTDKRKFKGMRKRSRDFAITHFDWTVVVDNYRCLIKETIET